MYEQRISFETSKLAKERGFDWLTHTAFNQKGNECAKAYEPIGTNGDSSYECNWNRFDEYFSSPAQSLLQKWLREKHNIDVEVIVYTRPHYCVTVVNTYGGIIDVYNSTPIYEEHPRAFEKYEEALEVGLQMALRLVGDSK